jgi:hypothetical protein
VVVQQLRHAPVVVISSWLVDSLAIGQPWSWQPVALGPPWWWQPVALGPP